MSDEPLKPPIWKLEAIDPKDPDWKGLFTGPVWVRAGNSDQARDTIAQQSAPLKRPTERFAPIRPSPWLQKASCSRHDDECEEIPEKGIVIADGRLLTRDLPSHWQYAKLDGNDPNCQALLDLFNTQSKPQHVRVFRRFNENDNSAEFYISAEAKAAARDRLKDVSFKDAGVPNLQALRADNFSDT
ncbi:MAG TPA: hypothetical protein VKS78_19540 [Roseiarcus sp.]|nr:hypothetical protein [Roseiarcus sp.]